jgi:hypothetical protein
MSGPTTGTFVPKTGTFVHRGSGHMDYRDMIAATLRKELGATHQAVKTLMRWTGAGERTVKHWLAGSRPPRGEHLIALMAYSDDVLIAVLHHAGRGQLGTAIKLATLKAELEATLESLRNYPSDYRTDRPDNE